MQSYYARMPGMQVGEDTTFPKDQYYNPPEDKIISTTVLRETADERETIYEFRYTKVQITEAKTKDGQWLETKRDLAALRLNPWWYSHESLYTPKNDGTGGPFTIGRVIHSSRSVGFTGWIGGVAVFNRALSATELAKLSSVRNAAPVITPAH